MSKATVMVLLPPVPGLPPLVNDSVIFDRQVLDWTNPLPGLLLDRFELRIDAWRYFNNGALNKPIGFAEVEVIGTCGP